MKTLYEKLTIEQQSKLEKGLINSCIASINSNVSYSNTLNVLKNEHYVHNLSLLMAMTIHDVFYPLNIFNFTELTNLFENE